MITETELTQTITSNLWLVTLIAAVGGYLIGSISTAIITCKILGLPDPRTTGSNNPGATNVLRYGGKKAAIITLIGDAHKGFVPVIATVTILKSMGIDSTMPAAAAGTAAFLGHLFPIFFGFRGGKGVATAFGMLLALSWLTWCWVTATWLFMAIAYRYSALSALTAFILAPLYIALVEKTPVTTGLMIVISLFIVWRHKANIIRLVRGEEDKINLGKKNPL